MPEIERLKELLFKTDARLSEDGKSIKCLLCGKSPKLGKCKRSAEGHIKYLLFAFCGKKINLLTYLLTHFNRVHSCTTNLKTSQAKFNFFGPAEKRQKTNETDSTEVLDHSQDSPNKNDE